MSNTYQNGRPIVYRTLFIGLGGSGGEVLCKLNDMLTEDQKALSHMLYLDLDKRSTDKLEARGIPTVRISSSDTVRDVMGFLGDDDGVNDWLPHGATDNGFLSSPTDDGASQYRIKSRLCLAKYLKGRNNELTRLLNKISVPGNTLINETLRVMIVSSIAGGTGAGTFIQVALYLREFFRNNGHKDINIMGLFACPDLFVNALRNDPGNESNIESMYSNAYAAIRELNAMNLSVSYGGADEIASGYGKAINISVKTKSEGELFDSKDPKFSTNSNNKPFNLMYFIDASSADGGVLRSLDQYYRVMADIVHTRLYSPIEPKLRADESNELSIHNNYPTAIYGSAGYGRIRYPYDDIIRYLSTRKTYEELDYTWSVPENEWEKYKREQKKIAKLSGTSWNETTEERGYRFVSDMNDLMSKPKFKFLQGMIKSPNSINDRTKEYLRSLNAAIKSASGMEGNAEDKDAKFSLGKDQDIRTSRRSMVEIYNNSNKKLRSKDNKGSEFYLNLLASTSRDVTAGLETYIENLNKNIVGKAVLVASQMIPRNSEDNITAINDRDPLNIFYGLLSMDGKAVHPLAARYLLYNLRSAMKKSIKDGDSDSAKTRLYNRRTDLELVFDNDRADGKDITVQMKIASIKKKFFISREHDAYEAVETYLEKFSLVMQGLINDATNNLKCEIYRRVLESVDLLIEQYEKLFENLNFFKTDLEKRVEMEKRLNERSSDDRCIFINASQIEKEYIYSGDLETRSALEEGSDEIAAAAGEGIYKALLERTWEKLEQKEKYILTDGYIDEEDDDNFSDMTYIFDNVIKIYKKFLMEKAPNLKANAARALIRQCCHSLNLSETDVVKNATNRINVCNAFETVINDMINKAEPMLNFDLNNVDTYYVGEDKNNSVAKTTIYMHLGMNPKLFHDLIELYNSDSDAGAAEAFHTAINGLNSIIEDVNFSEYEIVCFRAVHCLQPTQIYKFRENNYRGYFAYYKKRLALMNDTKSYSNTPHLDKRWHLREAMPYISRQMEGVWRKKTTKAFLFELLNENFTITKTHDGTKCFNYLPEGKDTPVYIKWPEDKLISFRDISRLVEFIGEKTELVEKLNDEFDKDIESILARLSNYNDSMPVYKTAVTKNTTLKRMREKLLVAYTGTSSTTIAHGDNIGYNTVNKLSDAELEVMQEAIKAIGGEEEFNEFWNLEDTLGGLLEIAWKVHKSEEAQNRDYDYGEAIIECGLEIVEKIARNMCGDNIDEDSAIYAEYVDLYNSVLEKFLESYVMSRLIDIKLFDAKKLNNMPFEIFHRYLKIPKIISDTVDYKWIKSKWIKK